MNNLKYNFLIANCIIRNKKFMRYKIYFIF